MALIDAAHVSRRPQIDDSWDTGQRIPQRSTIIALEGLPPLRVNGDTEMAHEITKLERGIQLA